MDAATTDQALKRIDAAIARIESALARRDAGEADLRRRHDELKAAVARSLGQIDELIAGRRR